MVLALVYLSFMVFLWSHRLLPAVSSVWLCMVNRLVSGLLVATVGLMLDWLCGDRDRDVV
jgi:hypothetical protein